MAVPARSGWCRPRRVRDRSFRESAEPHHALPDRRSRTVKACRRHVRTTAGCASPSLGSGSAVKPSAGRPARRPACLTEFVHLLVAGADPLAAAFDQLLSIVARTRPPTRSRAHTRTSTLRATRSFAAASPLAKPAPITTQSTQPPIYRAAKCRPTVGTRRRVSAQPAARAAGSGRRPPEQPVCEGASDVRVREPFEEEELALRIDLQPVRRPPSAYQQVLSPM